MLEPREACMLVPALSAWAPGLGFSELLVLGFSESPVPTAAYQPHP